MNADLLVTIETMFDSSSNTNNLPLSGLQQIALDEGLRLHAYQDEFGNWTIGIGHTPAYPGEIWSVNKAYNTFIRDVLNIAWNPVNGLPWTSNMDIIRKWVLVNMSYNMGFDAFLDFDEVKNGVISNDVDLVLTGMMDSKWYNEVTTRARQLMFQYWQNTWMINPLTSKQDRLLSQHLNTM